MTSPRHEFYETDERVTISIFDKGADPAAVSVNFASRSLKYTNGDKTLDLEPLKGEIDPGKSDFTVGKVKVEIRLSKRAPVRWGILVGSEPDAAASTTIMQSAPTEEAPRKQHKNWEQLADTSLKADPDKTTKDDPNAGGDNAVNGFFQQLFSGADEDTKRAMMKSFSESGGTALSTNWAEVKKEKTKVQPPEGSVWKKWG